MNDLAFEIKSNKKFLVWRMKLVDKQKVLTIVKLIEILVWDDFSLWI